jgi:hypothetical protein
MERDLFARLAAFAGAGLVSLALLDPEQRGLRILGLSSTFLALLLERRRTSVRVLAGLTLCFAVFSTSDFLYGADSINYFAYLRSLAFDRDLDFANEWQAWGLEPALPTATGLRANAQSVGPALVWSPFFLLAHLLVLVEHAFGAARHAADGLSDPYRRASALGTLTAVALGTWLLARALQSWVERGPARLAALAAVAASPVVYYVCVSPMMSHGVEFGVAAALLASLVHAREAASPGAWLAVGLCLGLLVAVRWQAAVYVLLVLPLALLAWRAGRARITTLLLAASLAALMLVPQLLAWRVLFGAYWTVPQGRGFMDWSSPHLLDTLVSANHGLFTWTPLMLPAALGLLLGLRRDPAFHAGAIAVCAATAWVNGGVRDWAAGDAFGARRFCLIVPLLALGLAHAVRALAGLARRVPLALPAAVLVSAALWNAGFVASFLETRIPDAAPLERVAASQARTLRRGLEQLLGAFAGPAGRAFAYHVLSGEYLFTHYNPNGTLNVADLPEQDLFGRWSARRRPPGEPAFRWALGPRSCVRIPLEAPFALRAVVTARAPRDWQPQTLQPSMNGRPLEPLPVATEWRDLDVAVPVAAQLPGENWLCLVFSNAGREPDGPRAAVAKVQVLAAAR